jgi:hypothetical protein
MGKKLIVLLTIIITCSVIAYFFSPSPITKKSKYLLPKKEIIIEEAKFIFKPVFEVTKEREILKILIEITSYINQDLVDLNYSKITMLECDDSFYQSTNYEIIEKSNNQLIVQLVFEPNNFIIKNQFTLKVFTYQENEISWN